MLRKMIQIKTQIKTFDADLLHLYTIFKYHNLKQMMRIDDFLLHFFLFSPYKKIKPNTCMCVFVSCRNKTIVIIFNHILLR
mmetsp:Transcript_16454/g.23056  ORF Transcript_16454/g.23056 Transcript_16454/m.23056 type:complete len:81 (+) Transcript_16454:510-752(+)